MECRMTVYTPKGQAAGAAGKFQTVGMFHPKELQIAPDGSSMTFTIEAPLKKMLKIQSRCAAFQEIAKQVIGHRITRVAVREDQKEQLDEFIEQTSITMQVTKPASAEEIAELSLGWREKFMRWFK